MDCISSPAACESQFTSPHKPRPNGAVVLDGRGCRWSACEAVRQRLENKVPVAEFARIQTSDAELNPCESSYPWWVYHFPAAALDDGDGKRAGHGVSKWRIAQRALDAFMRHANRKTTKHTTWIASDRHARRSIRRACSMRPLMRCRFSPRSASNLGPWSSRPQPLPYYHGRVAELADARDLKSREVKTSCGFEPRLGY